MGQRLDRPAVRVHHDPLMTLAQSTSRGYIDGAHVDTNDR
jgi:hypothetical protein